MNAVTDFDLGPLTWVKGETSLALERATEALSKFRAQGDTAQLKLCHTHLHQVHGVLTMLGLSGVAQVTAALEALPAYLLKQANADPTALNAIQNAVTALQQYLDGLLIGESDQPLRLFLPYQALMRAQGKTAAPSDLFYPDLTIPQPDRKIAPLPKKERNTRIHAERIRFQRGMLAWLRQAPGSAAQKAGLVLMRDAVQSIEALQEAPSMRGFWHAALGLMTALLTNANPRGDARAICVRIDLQIRRLLEGNPGVAERLLRDALFFIAQSAGNADPLLAELQTAYRLKNLLPTATQVRTTTAAPQESVLRRLKESVSGAEEQWNRFCGGSMSSLSAFAEQTRGIFQCSEQLGNEDLTLLAKALNAVATWLSQQPQRQTEGVAMEIATALILIQNARENFNHLSQDFSQQAKLMVSRLSDCVKGKPLSSEAIPLLDEISRRAQDRLLMAQVVREILNNLAQVEQSLDAYFRDPANTPLDTQVLERNLQQISGALTMLGHDDAVAYLDESRTRIQAFGKTSTPDSAAFEDVAQRLSIVGFFIEALQSGPSEFQSFAHQMLHPRARTQPASKAAAAASADSVEHQLERLKTEARSLLEALKTNPGSPQLRQELETCLKSLQKDADLIADQSLMTQVKAALAAMKEEDPAHAKSQIQNMVEAFAPIDFSPEAQKPSAETLHLAQSSDDEVDAELLGIFLEEAQEVLASIAENLNTLRQNPHDIDTLTTIRRNAHTLKGSGRMVGLKELGEVAWSMEQTLNLWLNQEQEATPELLDMIGQAHRLFGEWVSHLNTGDGLVPEYASFIAQAEKLRGGAEVRLAVSAAPPPDHAASPAFPSLDNASLILEEPSLGEPGAGTSVEASSASVTPGSDAAEVPGNNESAPAAEAAESLDQELTPEKTAPAQPETVFTLTDSEEILLSEPEPFDSGEETAESLEKTASAPDQELTQEEVGSVQPETPFTLADSEEFLLSGPEPPDSAEVTQESPEEAAPAPEEVHLPEIMEAFLDEEMDGTEPPLQTEKAPHPEKPVSESGDAPFPDMRDFEFLSSPDDIAAVPENIPAPEETDAEPYDSEIQDLPPQLFQIFQEEAQTYISRLNAFMANMLQTPEMPTPEESHRAAHTLAGISGTLGFTSVHDLSRALELALVRRNQTPHPENPEDRETLRQTIERLTGMLETVNLRRMPKSELPLIDALNGIYPVPLESNEAVEIAIPEPQSSGSAAPMTPHTPKEPIIAASAGVFSSVAEALQDSLDFDLLPIFLEEAVDLVNGLYNQISAWRADPASEAATHALARILHTFKGSARMTGAMRLGQFMHEVESRISELVGVPAQNSDLDEIETACDIMARVVECYQGGDYSADALTTMLAASAEAEARFMDEAETTEQRIAGVSLSADVSETISESTEEPPPATEEAPLSPTLPEEAFPDSAATPPKAPAKPEAEAQAQLRIRANLVDRLVNEAGEMAISRARIEGEMRDFKESLLTLTENVIRLRNQLREIEIQAETQIQAGDDETRANFDPLELDRFTRFQELTRMMAESVNDVSTVQQNLLKNLDDTNAAIMVQARLNRDLQQSLMSVRMLPFDSQRDRLNRLVRQVSRELKKQAQLEIVGGQVEMDRFVLEKIFSPLEHMIRNSVAHGLESDSERRAQGKPPVGKITLRLSQEGNEIILMLSDDGSGLDLQRIREKAEKQGLIDPTTPQDDQNLMDFIFHSGFSTAKEVSQISGRGVGMDVVKTTITSLGGRIEVLTESGKGTTFRLYLPLTLAVTQTVLVSAAGRKHAIPSNMIEQVMEIREKALNEVQGRGEAVWHDHRYPFHYLPRLLGDSATQMETRPLYWVLLLRSGSQRAAVLVDDLIGNQEIVVKNVGAQMARIVGISGATVLGNGQIALILNPVALAMRTPTVVVQDTPKKGKGKSKGKDKAAEIIAPIQHQPTVLVVDDSLTVRKITQKLLVREGYQVELAKDGVDAMEHLVDMTPDVILSDIEMPRMDGFDLVRHIRADERLGKIPIIMITSRMATKHRAHALEIGANQYLGKPYDETELLDLLARYTGRRSQKFTS